jgi:FkbM family methyltransferase
MKYYSQIKQDQWVLSKLGQKKNGIFIDVGAHSGIELSNTYVLEKEFGWTGVCVECNPETLPELKRNRTAKICEQAAFSHSGLVLNFRCDQDPTMSGISNLNTGTQVKTITLNDIIEQYNLPYDIDYISMDTEGTELAILKDFNFSKYNVKCWTIEHNIYSNGDVNNLWGLVSTLLLNNYLVKMHDWDIFAIKDDIEPEFHK